MESPSWHKVGHKEIPWLAPARSTQGSSFTSLKLKGKIIESVEIDPDVEAVTISFHDRTALTFNLEARLTVMPDFSDWKTGEARTIKRWPQLHGKSYWSWP